MQLMCDALAVFGSRHGLLINPLRRSCGIVRFDRFESLPELHIRAGVRVEGETVVLPLCPDGPTFRFHDQRMTPCTMSLMGIDPRSGIKLTLTVATPFRPRDAAFSTTPVLALRLSAEKIAGNFRWEGKKVDPQAVTVFLEFSGPAVEAEARGADTVDLRFASAATYTRGNAWGKESERRDLPQHDRLTGLNGRLAGTRFEKTIAFGGDETPLNVAWSTWSPPVLQVQGESCPFTYAARFPSAAAVDAWVRANPNAIFDNAAAVDGIVASNNASASLNRLLAQTLHSWLIDTWHARRPDGRPWYSVWEGSCYFHSTVDVEYTQTPFYLAVWPELLGIELDFWPEYSKDGSKAIGERGKGTLFLSHDTGSHASACGQDYHHEMEVEETANYLILSLAYYRRTGDCSVAAKHRDTIRKYLAFLRACDTSGCGVPDLGVANTIDDASPAVQFGRRQVYLAVKCLAAEMAGAEFAALDGDEVLAASCLRTAESIRSLLAEKGWAGDHFVTLLEKSGSGIVDPWSGEAMDVDEVPGWDAAHIYTTNGLALYDMVGIDAGLDPERLRTDLVHATERCLREYGCVHTDFSCDRDSFPEAMQGLAGLARNPGWISMNMLRDITAFYRGVDLRYLADRYWEWQTVTNTQDAKIFFETFSGNNLCFYPRGIAVWGTFDALGGLVIDAVNGIDRAHPAFPQLRLPRLFDADWEGGTCRMIGATL